MIYNIKIKINNLVEEYKIDSKKTIEDLKNLVTKKNSLKDNNYIDFYLEDNVPIRGMGKYNIEHGKMLQMYDSFILEKFNFECKKIWCFKIISFSAIV